MENIVSKGQRNVVVDELKGLGILLVILGHCLPWDNPVRVFIYSFHMPLFFIVAGYFLKKTTFRGQVTKDFSRLILPYIVISLVVFLSHALKWYIKRDFSLIDTTILPLLWGAGGGHKCVLIFSDIRAITQLWFLLALFWARVVANLLPRDFGGAIVGVVISVAATIVGRYVIFLPGGINEGLSALVFVLIGVYLRECGVNKYVFLLSVLAWIISLLYFDMVLAGCKYDCYPIQVIGSVGGTLSLYFLLNKIGSCYNLSRWLSWLGINSMAILCMHTIESHTIIWSVLHVSLSTDHYFVSFIAKVLFCILSTLILSRIRYTRDLLMIKCSMTSA
jgi:fucose 4-O-acetylase-like acetyltransferase